MGPHKTRYRKAGPGSLNNRYGARCIRAALWASEVEVWVLPPKGPIARHECLNPETLIKDASAAIVEPADPVSLDPRERLGRRSTTEHRHKHVFIEAHIFSLGSNTIVTPRRRPDFFVPASRKTALVIHAQECLAFFRRKDGVKLLVGHPFDFLMIALGVPEIVRIEMPALDEALPVNLPVPKQRLFVNRNRTLRNIGQLAQTEDLLLRHQSAIDQPRVERDSLDVDQIRKPIVFCQSNECHAARRKKETAFILNSTLQEIEVSTGI